MGIKSVAWKYRPVCLKFTSATRHQYARKLETMSTHESVQEACLYRCCLTMLVGPETHNRNHHQIVCPRNQDLSVEELSQRDGARLSSRYLNPEKLYSVSLKTFAVECPEHYRV